MRLFHKSAIVGSFIALAALANGQSVSLAVSVVDRWEIAVADARVSLTNSLTGTAANVTTDPSGEYVFLQVAPGSYDLTVRAPGYTQYLRRQVEAAPGSSSRVEARLDRSMSDLGTTVKQLEALIAAKPDDYLAHFNLARAYFTKGQIDKSAEQLQETIKLRRDYAPAWLALGQMALRGGGTSVALRCAQETIRLKPTLGPGPMLAAAVYRRQGQLDDAAEQLAWFLKTNPNDTDVLLELGNVNLQRKQYPDAEKEFSQAYRLDPEDLRGLQGLAETQLALNQPAKAVQLMTAEAEKYPDRTDLRKGLAAIEVQAKQIDKALTDYQAILEKYRDAPKEQASIYAGIAAAYQVQEDFSRAIENLKKAIQLAPDNFSYVARLASIYDLMGKPQDALTYYQQALKLDPGNAIMMNNAAYALVKAGGSVDDALRLVQLARRQLPDSNEILDTLGWIYLKKDMVDSASHIFEDLVEKAQTNSTYHYHYGMALAQKGDKAGALKELDLALRNNPAKGEQDEIKALIRKLS